MPESYNKKIAPNAKALRKNMTKEERHLWYDFLKDHPLHFYRQRIIGNYIVDFYCPSYKFAIELDGSQHFDDEGKRKDAERTAFIEGRGISILRIPNNEVMSNFRGVCEYIESLLTPQSPEGDSSL